jgi:hypothetical protein
MHMIVCHPSSSSFIVRRRAPVATSDGQRRSVIIIDKLRQMVTRYARQRPPWPSSSAVIDKVHPSLALICAAAAILRTFAVVQQAPLSITSSATLPSLGIEVAHRSMAVIMGRTHRAVAAAPSRRLLVLTLSYCAASCSRP